MPFTRIKDTHLVVDKLHILERRVGCRQRLAKRCIDGIHRPVAKRHLVIDNIADSYGRRGFGFHHKLAPCVEASFIHHPETSDGEIFRHLTKRAARQQLEAGLGGVKCPPFKFAILYSGDQLVDARVISGDIDAKFGDVEPLDNVLDYMRRNEP